MKSRERRFQFVKYAVLGASGLAALEGGVRVYNYAESARFERRDEAAEQLRATGITDERKAAYTEGLSELLYRTVIPDGTGEHIEAILRETVRNWQNGINEGRVIDSPDLMEFQESSPIRDDGYRLYLGLPQHHNSFTVSNYQPERSTEDKYYYAVNGWFERFLSHDNRFRYPARGLSQAERISQLVAVLEVPFDTSVHARAIQLRDGILLGITSIGDVDELGKIGEPLGMVVDKVEHGVIVNDSNFGSLSLGHVMLSLGHDDHGEYIAYYDRWDFGQPGQLSLNVSEVSTVVVGKPFEVYDRYYFDRTQLP